MSDVGIVFHSPSVCDVIDQDLTPLPLRELPNVSMRISLLLHSLFGSAFVIIHLRGFYFESRPVFFLLFDSEGNARSSIEGLAWMIGRDVSVFTCVLLLH